MKKIFLSSLLVASGIFVSSGLIAQEELTVRGNVLYSDQVNALKTPVPIINVPVSVSIITDEEIARQGYQQLGDLVRYTPGVSTSQGEGHRDAIVFRGNRSTADFFQDGVRDDVQYYRSLYNVEQVEILRGPNALLFGRGGTGGVINRVSKKGVLGETFGSFSIGSNTFGAYDFVADYNISINEERSLRIMAHRDYLNNHRSYYDGDRAGFNPTLKVKMSDNTVLDVSYEYADHQRFIDRGIPTGSNGEPVEALADIVFGHPELNTQTLTADILRATITRDISNTSKAIFSVTNNEFEKMYQNLYVAGYNATLEEVALDGYRDPTTRENLIISANFVNELELGSATHTILFGVEVVDTDNKNFRYNTNFSNAGALPLANDGSGIYPTGNSQAAKSDRETFSIADMRAGNFNRDEAGAAVTLDFTSSLNNSTTTEFEVTSFFLQDQIDVSDNLKILLGARYDDYEITVVNLKPGSEATVTKGEDLVSPRAGIIYKPQDNVSIYASYSNTFAPVAGEQYKAMSNNSSLGAVLDASETENTEIGLKWAISDELFLTAAYFDAERTAMTAVTVNNVAEQQAVVNQNVDGIEIELAGRISDQLELTMSYADFEGDTVSQNKEIPDYQFSAFANYQVNDKFGIGFGVTSQGDQQIGTSATPYLPSITRVDVAAYYQIADDLMLQMNIENLTDETYFPHSHSTHQASVGEEVNANFSIRRTF